jgi:hypothetical protein
MVLIDKIPPQDRPLAQRMLDAELARQGRLKEEVAKDPLTAPRLEQRKLFQNYKQLQFFDTLALYFNRVHPGGRTETKFEHVPRNVGEDVTVTISPRGEGVYALSPFPFAANAPEFAFAGRFISSGAHEKQGGWPNVLRMAPTVWEMFRLVAG